MDSAKRKELASICMETYVKLYEKHGHKEQNPFLAPEEYYRNEMNFLIRSKFMPFLTQTLEENQVVKEYVEKITEAPPAKATAELYAIEKELKTAEDPLMGGTYHSVEGGRAFGGFASAVLKAFAEKKLQSCAWFAEHNDAWMGPYAEPK